LMQKAGVASGMVQNAKDLFEDPQLKSRNYYWVMEHRVIGSYAHLGQAAILSRTPAQAGMPSPCLGEHTEQVCKQFLKISDKEFEELLSEGVFGSS
jgi:benzylsuccinate CoA-transferase BbsF subunit